MAWWTLSNLRSILTTETDNESPVSEELMGQIRENIECLFMLAFSTGVTGTIDTLTGETDINVADAPYSGISHAGRTVLITSGAALFRLYSLFRS